jgi:exopolysaccharide biosynthesis WecB/TagA/CpsF family protein
MVLISKLSADIHEGDLHTFINPYSYLLLRNNDSVFKEMDHILVDGELMVKLLKWIGVAAVTRTSFDMTSLAPFIFREAEEKGSSLYFVGSKQQEITASVKAILKVYPSLNISRYRNGYFNGEMDAELELVLELDPDIVIAGLGTPLQEEFLIKLKKKGWKGTGFTCGGFLHQTSSGIEYYPKWINKYNLRWAYRIYDEPKLFGRYFLDYPKAVVLILWDLKIKRYFK